MNLFEVFLIVTLMAEILKVVPVECDAWVVDVLCIQVALVMHDVTGNDQATGKAPLTQSSNVFDVTVTTLKPCSCLIESFSLVHVLGNTKATSARLMASACGFLV